MVALLAAWEFVRFFWDTPYLAVAHSILVAIYHVLKDGVPFRDLGADYYNQFNKDSKIRAYLKKLHALGWSEPTAAVVAPV